jgi:copper homeostasis protein
MPGPTIRFAARTEGIYELINHFYGDFDHFIELYLLQCRSGLSLNGVIMELEICVDSVESAIAAEEGGAQRIELCSALAEGGLTPSIGMIRAVRSRIGIAVNVIIRPRGGDFFYSQDEWQIMQDDIAYTAHAGADGIVLGLLTANGDVDVERTRNLVEIAQPMEVTFHRAIDMARDVEQSLEDVIRTGANRVLTSGTSQTAVQGAQRIASLVQAAGNRIGVMVCGNVRPANVEQIVLATGAREFHASLRAPVPSPVRHRNSTLNLGDPGRDEYERLVVSSADVRQLRLALDAIGSRTPI